MESKSFIEIIKDNIIVIPQIQRDYAQGRNTSKINQIRHEFLDDIIETLIGDKDILKLDFIYGSINDNAFIPLDGQQRLTTLFLLHWYLTPKIDVLLTDKDESKFSYKTRVSSKDFCNQLANNSITSIKDSIKSIVGNIKVALDKESDEKKKKEYQEEIKSWTLSKGIKNESWFAWSWIQDPTVHSMLVMLDAIDDRFIGYSQEELQFFWDKLVNQKVIKFDKLDLDEFGLSDELYVKMNARGKELSEFDKFKSTLEEQMLLNDVEQVMQDNWRTKFDSKWMDIFFNRTLLANNGKLDSTTIKKIEFSYLCFLKRMMVFHLFSEEIKLDYIHYKNGEKADWDIGKLNRELPFKVESDDEDKLLGKLREYSVRNDVLKLTPFLCKVKFFNQGFFEFISNTFENVLYKNAERVCEISDKINGVYFDRQIQNLFDAFIDEKIDYDIRVQYFAVIQFAKHHKANELSQSDEFNSWMRVVRNLSTSSNIHYYNTWKNFKDSLDSIVQIISNLYANGNNLAILEYLEKSEIKGFNSDQIEEEKRKAQLMNNSNFTNNWIKVIREAEEHKYLTGQVRFLLDWVDNSPTEFEKYYNIFSSIFSDKGIIEALSREEYLFKNAMLCSDNWYLLNTCFMYDEGKDRDWSWKRYLREKDYAGKIKNLFDEIFKITIVPIEDKFKSYINSKTPSDWRKCFIEYPKIYDELKGKKINWWHWDYEKNDGEICLLSKSRWSSRHKELRTYYWSLKYKGEYLNSHAEQPFTALINIESDNNLEITYSSSVNRYRYDNEVLDPGSYNIVGDNFDFSRICTTKYTEVERILDELLEHPKISDLELSPNINYVHNDNLYKLGNTIINNADKWEKWRCSNLNVLYTDHSKFNIAIDLLVDIQAKSDDRFYLRIFNREKSEREMCDLKSIAGQFELTLKDDGRYYSKEMSSEDCNGLCEKIQQFYFESPFATF